MSSVPRLVKNFNFLLSLLLLIGSIFLSREIIQNSKLNQRHKIDYAELNNVKYGLFNIEVWRDQLVAIIASEFDKIYLSKETEADLRRHLSNIMNKIIDQASAKLEKLNMKSSIGKIKQAFIDMFVDIKDLKEGIPQYTNAVIKEFKKPKTKEEIKSLVNEQLDEYAQKTADAQDKSDMHRILKETGSKDILEARSKLNQAILFRQDLIIKEAIALVLLSLCIFGLFFQARHQRSIPQYLILVFSLVTLMVCGIATPMIDMEAKISRLKFMLIGNPIQFDNQVLYFQSKSILDVFWLMVTDSHLQMKVVGILVVVFSVFFPFTKLLASVAYYAHLSWARRSKMVEFFVFKSGKWSMADVMVVAIFMSYIGFNGVIDSQLRNLNSLQTGVEVLTTNGTSLQPGYYLFLTYVVLAILMSAFLKKNDSSNSSQSVEGDLGYKKS